MYYKSSLALYLDILVGAFPSLADHMNNFAALGERPRNMRNISAYAAWWIRCGGIFPTKDKVLHGYIPLLA